MSLIFLKSICIMLFLLAYVCYLCLTDLRQKAPVCVSNKEYLGGIKMLNHSVIFHNTCVSSVILASFCKSDLSKHKNQNHSVTGVWLCSFYLCLSRLLQVGALSNKYNGYHLMLNINKANRPASCNASKNAVFPSTRLSSSMHPRSGRRSYRLKLQIHSKCMNYLNPG